jgi:hypothetical protein
MINYSRLSNNPFLHWSGAGLSDTVDAFKRLLQSRHFVLRGMNRPRRVSTKVDPPRGMARNLQSIGFCLSLRLTHSAIERGAVRCGMEIG